MKLIVDSDSIVKTYISTSGYVLTTKGEYVHRLVAEKALGRKLKTDEHVHHVDYDKANNKNSNLVICSNKTHKMYHARTDAVNAGFDPNEYSLCWACKTYHKLDMFPKHYKSWNGVFTVCKEKTNSRRRAAKYKSKKIVFTERQRNLDIARKTKFYMTKKGITDKVSWLW